MLSKNSTKFLGLFPTKPEIYSRMSHRIFNGKLSEKTKRNVCLK